MFATGKQFAWLNCSMYSSVQLQFQELKHFTSQNVKWIY